MGVAPMTLKTYYLRYDVYHMIQIMSFDESLMWNRLGYIQNIFCFIITHIYLMVTLLLV